MNVRDNALSVQKSSNPETRVVCQLRGAPRMEIAPLFRPERANRAWMHERGTNGGMPVHLRHRL